MGARARFDSDFNDSDAVMWDLERDPQLRSTITAIAVLDGPVDWELLVDSVDRASRVIPRLRQRVVRPPMRLGPPRWAVDPDFDLTYHLRRVEAPYPRDLRAVLDLARAAAMAGFDRARPLWEFTLVEGLDGGRAALVEKLHHSVTDGVGGMQLALLLYDHEAEPGDRGALPPAPAGEQVSTFALARDAIRGLGRGSLRGALRTAGALVDLARHTAAHPARTAMTVGGTARSTARLFAPVTETLSPVMAGRSISWHYDVFDTELDDLRRAAKAVGGSVNDVFVAGVAGGLARYHEARDRPVAELRMTLPVNLREDGDPLGGNHFAPVRFVVPVGIGDPAERIRRIGTITRAWRAEPALAYTGMLATVLERLPGPVLSGLFGAMLKRVDFVATNVPGFRHEVYLGGAPVARHYVLAPPTGAALNVSLLSHLGLGCIGVVSDAAAVPDPAVLALCLEEGMDEVLSLGRRPR